MSHQGGEREWNSADEVSSDDEQEQEDTSRTGEASGHHTRQRSLSALLHGYSDIQVREYLTNHPEVARSVTSGELTRLLHREHVSVDVLRLLYEASPEAFNGLRTYETLTYLADRIDKADVTCYLVDVCPSLVIPTFSRDIEGEIVAIPLHVACESGNLELVKTICERVPDAILQKDGNGSTPIHQGRFSDRKGGVHRDIAELLARTKPDVLMMRNSRGYTPLHFAVSIGGSSEKAAAMILEMCPAAAGLHDGSDMYPLQAYLTSPEEAFSVSFLSALIQAHPQAVRGRAYGRLALNYAFHSSTKATADIVKVILKANPASSRAVLRGRDRSLHYALRAGYKHGTTESIAVLIEVFPAACEQSNQFGQTPLHALLEKTDSRADLVKLLLESSLKPLTMQTNDTWTGRKGRISGIDAVSPNATPLSIALDWSSETPTDQGTETLKILCAFDSIGNCVGDAKRDTIIAALESLHDVKWSKGVAIILERYPFVIGEVRSFAVPTALSFIGRHCSLGTVFSALKSCPSVVEKGTCDDCNEEDDKVESSSCRTSKRPRI
mmetsp:Transcript_29356/g.64702  ORF Transcript_29356/g.64702 Transcript_29356/m.64702 type:complete len:554 (+) Transcript_29356:238-1899(+)